MFKEVLNLTQHFPFYTMMVVPEPQVDSDVRQRMLPVKICCNNYGMGSMNPRWSRWLLQSQAALTLETFDGHGPIANPSKAHQI